MQMNMSNNVNISTANIKDVANTDTETYAKSKSEDKFSSVLQKEKKNICSNENKTEKEVGTSKIKMSNLKNTSSQPKDNAEVEKLELKDDRSIEKKSTELEIKVDEDIEGLSKDDVLNYLALIVELINKMDSSKIKAELQNIRGEGSTLNSEVSNIEINDSVAYELSLTGTLKNSVLNTDNEESSLNQQETAKVINNLLSSLETGEDNELLNNKTLNTIEGLISQLEMKLNEEVGSKDIKTQNVLRELVKDLKTEINSLLETKTTKDPLQNSIVDKVLVLKEENPKAKNIDTTSNKVINEVNYSKEVLSDKSLSNSGKDSNQNPSSTLNKEISKEEKLLSSILQDGDEKANNKFSLLVNRIGTQTNTPVNAAPEVINKEFIAVDVMKSVKFMVTNNIKEMTVKINPGQLGEITIKVIEEGGIMKANIKASSKETYNLLTQQLGDIKKHLGEQSIKIQEVNISIYDEDTTFYKDGQFSSNSFQDESNNRKNNGTEFIGEFTEEELNNKNELYEEGNINMLA